MSPVVITAPSGTDIKEETILLHCCCGPCSTAIIEWMAGNGLRPGIFFSNSNIFPEDEYVTRREELRAYAASFGMETFDDDYDHASWLRAVKGFENEPERGARCLKCFEFRLYRAALFALSHGYGLLTTTLASSRWKDLEQVNQAGVSAVDRANRSVPASEAKLLWWNQNWRKGGLQERRSCIIRERGMYNQTFCGCEFSRRSENGTKI